MSDGLRTKDNRRIETNIKFAQFMAKSINDFNAIFYHGDMYSFVFTHLNWSREFSTFENSSPFYAKCVVSFYLDANKLLQKQTYEKKKSEKK